MKSVPLTRARHASNFVIALENKGMPSDRLLNRANLPAGLLNSIGEDGVISALSMLDFAENAALHTDILDLGYWAGIVPLEGYGKFGKRVVSAPTLHGAITTFCRDVHSECSEADYYLKHDGANAWFCHGPVGNSALQQSQHELYALMIIIQVLQLALGPDWQPKRIRLQSLDDSGVRNNDFLLKTDIEFGAPITAVEFPLKSLATPLLRSVKAAYASLDAESAALFENLPGDPLMALKELITLYARQYKMPSIELTSELAGVSRRTLQRFLHSKATSYSDLLDEVKFNMALPLLSDRSNSITAISVELGYSNVAHFSRAFKRITGMSPNTYRHLLNQ